MASTLIGACSSEPSSRGSSPLPLQPVAEIALPGDNSRFDYESLDPQHGLLFIAHLGASEVIEIDIHTQQVVRTIPNPSQVHGVLVVPALRRVYVTATGDDRLVILDEDTVAVIGQATTGEYPDGIAYDPTRGAVWTTNESGGTETVIDAVTAQVRGSVDLGGDVGNVAYDPVATRCRSPCTGRAISPPSTPERGGIRHYLWRAVDQDGNVLFRPGSVTTQREGSETLVALLVIPWARSPKYHVGCVVGYRVRRFEGSMSDAQVQGL